jgi:hypothetical protein
MRESTEDRTEGSSRVGIYRFGGRSRELSIFF